MKAIVFSVSAYPLPLEVPIPLLLEPLPGALAETNQSRQAHTVKIIENSVASDELFCQDLDYFTLR